MLAPTDRRLLLSVLAPPEGYTLDQAVGTTYTLDLLALLRVPLAATTLPWAGAQGEPIENPFALLTALRRNASKVSLFCHAGATKIPARHVGLLTFLEEAVHPVSPPRSGVFHPKIWLLRFLAEDDDAPAVHRLVVLSRNLTFDRSWDVALSLDGEVADRQRGYSSNRPLSDFIGALPRMAAAAGAALNDRARRRIELVADEVRRVVWELPEGFSEHRFHPIGHDGRPRWPIRDVRRLLVLSPFVGAPALARLRREVPEDLTLIGRFEELARLDPEVRATLDQIEVFDDPGSSLDVEDLPSSALPTTVTRQRTQKSRIRRSSRGCTRSCSSASAGIRLWCTSDRPTRPAARLSRTWSSWSSSRARMANTGSTRCSRGCATLAC